MKDDKKEAQLRVGYVLKRYPKFSETFVVNEILALERQGVDIEIFALRPSVEVCFHENLSKVRAPIHYVPYGSNKSPQLLSTLARAADRDLEFFDRWRELYQGDVVELEQGLYLAEMLFEKNIQILHAHFATTATAVSRVAAHITGIPYTFTAHAKDIFHESVNRDQLSGKIADAGAVITISQFNFAYLCDEYPAMSNKLKRIYNGLELSSLSITSTEAATDVPTILAVARLVEKKGIQYLLRALMTIRKQVPSVHCDIVGDGVMRQDLEQLAHNLKVDDCVTFHGLLPQWKVHELIRRAQVFAAPCVLAGDGDRDGLPTVLLEAMALGTPCVSTPVTGIPEVLRHRQTGLLVPSDNADELANSCLELIGNAELSRTLSEAARSLIEAKFDVDKNTKAHRQTWVDLLNERPAAALGVAAASN